MDLNKWVIWFAIVIIGAALITLVRYLSYRHEVKKYFKEKQESKKQMAAMVKKYQGEAEQSAKKIKEEYERKAKKGE